MSTPTIRDHCAALNDDVDYLLECIRDGSSDPITLQEIADRADDARDALAAEPAGEGPRTTPSQQQIDDLLEAIFAAYSAQGWVADEDFICLFEEVARLAGIVEEGWDASANPGNTKAKASAALAHRSRPATPPAPEVGEGSDYDQEGTIAAVILDHSRVAASLGCPDPERNLGRVLRESDFGATARAILAHRSRPATTTETL
jgi:hypothetical protein